LINFKKLAFPGCLLVLMSLSLALRAEVLMPSPPELAAKAWILVDANTGKVLVEQNADEQLPPASLTKLMTSYIVSEEIKSGRVKESDLVRISVNAWEKGGWKSGSSTMSLAPNSEVPVIDLIRGVIIQSGNDASIALAEHIAGSEEGFSQIMNQQASLLGMNNSHFVNATGWPAEGHLTTARDLSILARHEIREHPEHYKIYSERYFEYNGVNQPNRNRLLWRDSSVDGMKTGHTEAAGYCLVASAERHGMRLISVVMGTSGEEARARESQKLLAFGFRYYETAKVYSAGDVLQENNRVWYGDADQVNLVVADDLYLTIPRGARDELEAGIETRPTLEAPIAAGQELGRLKVKYQGETLLDVPLVADRSIPEAGLFARIWDAIVLFVLNLLG